LIVLFSSEFAFVFVPAAGFGIDVGAMVEVADAIIQMKSAVVLQFIRTLFIEIKS
jgi:hypothetical protein